LRNHPRNISDFEKIAVALTDRSILRLHASSLVESQLKSNRRSRFATWPDTSCTAANEMPVAHGR